MPQVCQDDIKKGAWTPEVRNDLEQRQEATACATNGTEAACKAMSRPSSQQGSVLFAEDSWKLFLCGSGRAIVSLVPPHKEVSLAFRLPCAGGRAAQETGFDQWSAEVVCRGRKNQGEPPHTSQHWAIFPIAAPAADMSPHVCSLLCRDAPARAAV